MNLKIILATVYICVAMVAYAQNVLSGHVSDALGSPLSGANVHCFRQTKYPTS